MKYLDDLMFWVGERERIRIKKERRERRPWSSDVILNTYRFCNVERERDTVTKWIHTNWLHPNLNDPTLPMALAVARMVNWPDTLADLGYPRVWNPHHFIMTLEARKLTGLKVWTAAYMITGGYSAGGEAKEAIIARVLTGLHSQLAKIPILDSDSLEVAAEKLKTPGIGSFLSAQIVADLKFAPLLSKAKDWSTWCAPGPGSTMGLNFLHGRGNKAIGEKQFINEVNEVRELLAAAGVHIDAQNTQNCLCEFSKYVRAKHFGDRLKSGYTPAVA